MKQVTLSEVITQIKLGKGKGEIKELFALSAGQYKQLINHPQVIAAFESIKAEKEAAKEAKRNKNKLVIVDDLNTETTDVGFDGNTLLPEELPTTSYSENLTSSN
jgi:hypothetical protein